MSDIQAVAKAFVEFYYSTFDRNRAELGPLYVRLVYVAYCFAIALLMCTAATRGDDPLLTLSLGPWTNRETCRCWLLRVFISPLRISLCLGSHSNFRWTGNQFQGTGKIVEKLVVRWLTLPLVFWTLMNDIDLRIQNRPFLLQRFSMLSRRLMLNPRIPPLGPFLWPSLEVSSWMTNRIPVSFLICHRAATTLLRGGWHSWKKSTSFNVVAEKFTQVFQLIPEGGSYFVFNGLSFVSQSTEVPSEDANLR